MAELIRIPAIHEHLATSARYEDLSRLDAQRLISFGKSIYQNDPWGYYTIANAKGDPVGRAGITIWAGQPYRRVRELEPESIVEVGVLLHPHSQGRGYADQAVRQLVDLVDAESDVNDVFILVHQDNLAMRRVAQRAGFQCIGRAKTVHGWRQLHALSLSGTSKRAKVQRPGM